MNKTKKRNLVIIFAAIAGVAVVLLFVHCCVTNLFGREQPETIVHTETSVKGNELSIDLVLSDTRFTFASVNVEEESEGVVTVRPKIVTAWILKNGWESTSVFQAHHEITEVRLYDEVIWLKEEEIVVKSSELSARWIHIWEEWDRRDEMQRTRSTSTVPGNTSDFFYSWDAAVDFIGFSPWNPLESQEELEKNGFTVSSLSPAQTETRHVEVQARGTHTGLINYLLVRAVYTDGPVWIWYDNEPFRSVMTVDPKKQPDDTVTLVDGTSVFVYHMGNYAKITFRRARQNYSILFTNYGGGDYDDIRNSLQKVLNVLNEAVR